MIVVLDTNILGGIVNPKPRSEAVKAMQKWGVEMLAAGHVFVIPSIAVYETRRELLRGSMVASATALDLFIAATPNIYLPMNDAAMTRAARLWADVRNAGQTTA